MIDCGQGIPGYVPLLEESLKQISPDAYISDIIITHAHPDHFDGVKDVLGSGLLNKNNRIMVHKYPGQMRMPKSSGQVRLFPEDIPVADLHDNQVFRTDSITLKVIHTPGHTRDHCAFWLEEENSIFTADCVLGHGTVVFEDLSSYLSSLRKMLALNPKRLYPGHGAVVEDGISKIKEYIQHREAREEQIVGILRSSDSKYWTSKDIVEKIYSGLPETVFFAACRGIILHLLKLEKDGVARMAEGPSGDADLQDLVDNRWQWVGSNLSK